MKTKIDIRNIRGEVIFSFKKEDNTLKDTVEEAIRQGFSLKGANLYGENLSGANLRGANLSGANLNDTNLMGDDLRGTDLSYADLYFSYLQYANLRGANLRGANLRYAKLEGVDLEGAKIEDADLCGAYLIEVKNIPDLPLVCPSEGEFIAWKKISCYKEDYGGEFLVKLLIPEDAERSSATTEKCRCSKAKVLEITNRWTGEHVDVITSLNWTECVYRVGEMVYPDSFDKNRWNECSNGIHFFMEKEKAINYII